MQWWGEEEWYRSLKSIHSVPDVKNAQGRPHLMPWKLDGKAWNWQSQRELNKSLMPPNGPFPMKFCLKHSSIAPTPGIPAWGWRELCACVCGERRKNGRTVTMCCRGTKAATAIVIFFTVCL
jgi:hypothetical protein